MCVTYHNGIVFCSLFMEIKSKTFKTFHNNIMIMYVMIYFELIETPAKRK